MDKILLQIAAELKVRPAQVNAAVTLLDGGATVPFIARYRKEVTDNLDDIQLRELESRLGYLRELEDRRAAVLKSIEEQGKLTPELAAAIDAAPTKQELEDLYLPFKQKRRTKGMIAREAGLEPLADMLFADPTLDPQAQAAAFINADGGFADAFAVLDGVRDLLSERWAEDAALVKVLREWLWDEGLLQSKKMDGKDEHNADVAKFRDYFDYSEPIRTVPSHRALAVFRGRTQEILDAKLILDEELVAGQPSLAEGRIARHLGWAHGKRAGDDLIKRAVSWTWKVKLSLSLERDLFGRVREEAEKVAIRVFAENLRDLLLAAPAGKRVVMGLDPGIRTGVKVAVVSRHRQGAGHAHRLPARAAPRLGGLAACAGPAGGAARRQPDRHRQRHRQPRDRQAGRRPHQARAAARARRHDREDRGQRGGRLGVLGLRVRQQGAARPGRQPARRRLHRAPPAGSAGRAGEDRPQEHRRGPVPARRQPERADEDAGRGGRGLREQGRRRPEHRVGAAAGARVGPEPGRGQLHRALARRQRRVRRALAAAGRDRPRPQDLRAGRRLPAHPRRHQPAGHDRRAPRDLPGGRAHAGRHVAGRSPS